MIVCIASDDQRFAAVLPPMPFQPATVIEDFLRDWSVDTSSAPSLPGADGFSTARIVFEPHPRDLDFSDVAVIRIAPECSPSLGPLSDWPPGFADDLRPRARVVNGGTRLLGARHTSASRVELITAIDDLADSGSQIFAVAAAGALSDGSPEERLAMLIRERVPNAIVVLSAEIGGVGLRERESCAILNAGLMRWAAARRIELSQAFPTADIFIGRGSGGMVSADYFERFPLVAFESINGAIVSRIVEQHSLRDAVVAIPQDGGEYASIYFVNSGQVARQEQSQFAGVIINMNGFRKVRVPVEKLDAAGAEWDGLPLVRLGTTPESAKSNASLLLTAAYGIGSAQVRTEVTRVMAGLGTGRLGAFAEGVADELRGRAITAGANPLRLGIPSIEASPMAYLPEGSLIVRAQLSGESR